MELTELLIDIKNKTKSSVDKMLHFKIESNVWLLIGLFLIVLALLIIPTSIKINYIASEKIEAEKLSIKDEMTLLSMQLDSYKNEVAEVVQIRDTYRNSIKEIVELLYIKDTHLGIGGFEGNSVERTDEVNLITIRNIIASMNDDQLLLIEVKKYLEIRKDFIGSFPYIWPVDTGGVPHISSGYGFREDLFSDDKGLHLHAGIDIDLSIGTPVVATADGIVLYSFYDEVMGNLIVIKHRNGFETTYSHLYKRLVKAGESVKRGEKIGEVGNTGLTTGPHLHYEVRQEGISLDPMIFLSTNF